MNPTCYNPTKKGRLTETMEQGWQYPFLAGHVLIPAKITRMMNKVCNKR